MREIVKQSVEYMGPIYLRLGKNGEPHIHSDNAEIEIGRGIEVTQGNDLALITTSNMLEQGKLMVNEWAEKGKYASLISMPTIKPFDEQMIHGLIQRDIPIYTLEEHNIIGGLGSAVAEVIAESGSSVKFKRIGIPDTYTHLVGSQSFLRKKLIMDHLEFD